MYRRFTQTENPIAVLVMSSAALAMTKHDIRTVVDTELEEDRPDREAVECTFQLLEAANNIEPIYQSASDVENFEKDLFVHWATPKKRITLISPSQAEQGLRLYRRTHTGWSQLTQHTTAADLRAALRWVLQ
jgi:hypothetical protein